MWAPVLFKTIEGIGFRSVERRKIHPIGKRINDQVLVAVALPSPVLAALANRFVEELPAGMVGRAVLEADDVRVRGRAVPGRRRGFPLGVTDDGAELFLAFRRERLRGVCFAHAVQSL